jgi:hypothetical protein
MAKKPTEADKSDQKKGEGAPKSPSPPTPRPGPYPGQVINPEAMPEYRWN